MRAYTAFVPSLVMERIARDPGEAATAYEEEFPAALLFVDIVGYVKLTDVTHKGVMQRERQGTAMERLQSKGAAGRLDAEDVVGIAGLTGRTHDAGHPVDTSGIYAALPAVFAEATFFFREVTFLFRERRCI